MHKITFLFLIFGLISSAQETYDFDHLLEYNYQRHLDTVVEKKMILTNSKSNYFVIISEVSDSHFKLQFNNTKGVMANFMLPKDEFWKHTKFSIPCRLTFKTRAHKRKTNQYEFHKLKDTLLNTVPHPMYVLKNRKTKREKRRNLARLYYAIEPGTEHHKPLFLRSVAYLEWKKEKSVPNGIPKQWYFVEHSGDTLMSYSLRKINKLTKVVELEEDCKPEYRPSNFFGYPKM